MKWILMLIFSMNAYADSIPDAKTSFKDSVKAAKKRDSERHKQYASIIEQTIKQASYGGLLNATALLETYSDCGYGVYPALFNELRVKGYVISFHDDGFVNEAWGRHLNQCLVIISWEKAK